MELGREVFGHLNEHSGQMKNESAGTSLGPKDERGRAVEARGERQSVRMEKR